MTTIHFMGTGRPGARCPPPGAHLCPGTDPSHHAVTQIETGAGWVPKVHVTWRGSFQVGGGKPGATSQGLLGSGDHGPHPATQQPTARMGPLRFGPLGGGARGHTRPRQWWGSLSPGPSWLLTRAGHPPFVPWRRTLGGLGLHTPPARAGCREQTRGSFSPEPWPRPSPSISQEEGPGSCTPHSGPATTRKVLAVLGAPRGPDTNTLAPQTSWPAARPPGTEGSSTRGGSAWRVCSGKKCSRPIPSSALPEPGRPTDVSFKQLNYHKYTQRDDRPISPRFICMRRDWCVQMPSSFFFEKKKTTFITRMG